MALQDRLAAALPAAMKARDSERLTAADEYDGLGLSGHADRLLAGARTLATHLDGR